MSSVLFCADAEIKDKNSQIRKQAHKKVDQELESILKRMKKHSEKAGKIEFERFQTEEGLTPDNAITKLCYGCTRQQFENAVKECKLRLARIASKNPDQAMSIFSRFNLDEAIQVALNN